MNEFYNHIQSINKSPMVALVLMFVIFTLIMVYLTFSIYKYSIKKELGINKLEAWIVVKITIIRKLLNPVFLYADGFHVSEFSSWILVRFVVVSTLIVGGVMVYDQINDGVNQANVNNYIKKIIPEYENESVKDTVDKLISAQGDLNKYKSDYEDYINGYMSSSDRQAFLERNKSRINIIDNKQLMMKKIKNDEKSFDYYFNSIKKIK